MSEPRMVSRFEPTSYVNGVYPHESFKRRHRVQVLEVGGGGVAVVLLIGAMAASAIALGLGAIWMARTFIELLGRGG